jgi:hypothetical protein
LKRTLLLLALALILGLLALEKTAPAPRDLVVNAEENSPELLSTEPENAPVSPPASPMLWNGTLCG